MASISNRVYTPKTLFLTVEKLQPLLRIPPQPLLVSTGAPAFTQYSPKRKRLGNKERTVESSSRCLCWSSLALSSVSSGFSSVLVTVPQSFLSVAPVGAVLPLCSWWCCWSRVSTMVQPLHSRRIRKTRRTERLCVSETSFPGNKG